MIEPLWKDINEYWSTTDVVWNKAYDPVTLGSPTNTRYIEAPVYIVSASVPTPGATVASASTDGLNFLTPFPYPMYECILIQMEASDIENTAGANAITYGLQHSADDITYVDIPELSTRLLSVTNSNGTGDGNRKKFMLPPSAKQYIRMKVTVPVGAATAAGLTGSFTCSAQF